MSLKSGDNVHFSVGRCCAAVNPRADKGIRASRAHAGLTFSRGGADYRTLYLAAPTSIYRVRMRVRGMAAFPLNSQ
ncbi:MAG: hypothetical protein M1608_03240 [Candidatus Omnitrophica bacterium]|nr:hypothetical protein [Candidatus Omnitrophota bacterium]